MRLPNIEASDAALGESVLPPSYHGRVHEPEPVECTECDGSGRSQITTKGHVVPTDCPHCHGEGVTEP